MVENKKNLHVRVSRELHDTFTDKCISIDRTPSHVVREMMKAYVDGRLTIIPTKEQQQGGFYVN